MVGGPKSSDLLLYYIEGRHYLSSAKQEQGIPRVGETVWRHQASCQKNGEGREILRGDP